MYNVLGLLNTSIIIFDKKILGILHALRAFSSTSEEIIGYQQGMNILLPNICSMPKLATYETSIACLIHQDKYNLYFELCLRL